MIYDTYDKFYHIAYHDYDSLSSLASRLGQDKHIMTEVPPFPIINAHDWFRQHCHCVGGRHRGRGGRRKGGPAGKTNNNHNHSNKMKNNDTSNSKYNRKINRGRPRRPHPSLACERGTAKGERTKGHVQVTEEWLKGDLKVTFE